MSDDVILSDEDMEETLKAIESEDEAEDTTIDEIPEDDADLSADDDTGESEEDSGLDDEEDDVSDDVEEFSTDSEVEESDNSVRPPSTWTAEAKSQWSSLPPRIKQEILKREEDIGRGISNYKQRAEIGDRYQQVMQPYQAMINAAGVSTEHAIQSVMNTMYRLQTGTPQQKAQLLLQTAQQYGADLEVLRAEPDPQQAALQNYLSPLQQEIQQLRQQISSQSHTSEQAQMAEVTSKIEAFRNAADEKGNQLYPYFDNLRVQMGALIEARDAEIQQQISTNGFSNLTPMSLEEAYESAAWSHPETRNILSTKQQTNSEEERKRIAREKAAKAKKADKTNVKSKPARSNQKPKPVGSVEDTMREVMKDIQSRVN